MSPKNSREREVYAMASSTGSHLVTSRGVDDAEKHVKRRLVEECERPVASSSGIPEKCVNYFESGKDGIALRRVEEVGGVQSASSAQQESRTVVAVSESADDFLRSDGLGHELGLDIAERKKGDEGSADLASRARRQSHGEDSTEAVRGSGHVAAEGEMGGGRESVSEPVGSRLTLEGTLESAGGVSERALSGDAGFQGSPVLIRRVFTDDVLPSAVSREAEQRSVCETGVDSTVRIVKTEFDVESETSESNANREGSDSLLGASGRAVHVEDNEGPEGPPDASTRAVHVAECSVGSEATNTSGHFDAHSPLSDKSLGRPGLDAVLVSERRGSLDLQGEQQESSHRHTRAKYK